MKSFDESIPTVLLRTLDAVMPMFRRICQRHELTDQQWRVLRVVWQDTSISMRELATRTFISPSSLAGVVQRLQRRDLVVRHPDPRDGRGVQVQVTAQGRALYDEVAPALEAAHAAMMRDIDEQAWRQAAEALAAIARAAQR